MPRIYWAIRFWASRIDRRLKYRFDMMKLVLLSLTYNSFLDVYYVGDTAMEPIFWFVDHFTHLFGPVFVIGVCLLTASVVLVAYLIGIPYYWHQNIFLFIVVVTFGHWLLMNVCFHYWMAARTSPGNPPESTVLPEAVSICKRCIAPKPPRTHHCSVCNKCILKMDHHCPWLNNCIGHYNHRYFFLYCVYMVIGALFLVCFGLNIVLDHLEKYRTEDISNRTISNNHIKCGNPPCIKDFNTVMPVLEKLEILNDDPALPWQYERWYHGVLTYVTLLCIGVVLALGSLTIWHAIRIGRGETSIEAHINRSERFRYKKEGKIYANPYDFGTRDNWRLFLGLHHGRSWRHVLLPSRHLPLGNGLQWHTIRSRNSAEC
ncbi:hypothetical protein CHUAL_008131 [Chamberlinius hualienensis]